MSDRAPLIPIEVDGAALVRAKRRSAKAFEKIVNWYRERGATDVQIVDAMVTTREMIDRVGRK